MSLQTVACVTRTSLCVSGLHKKGDTTCARALNQRPRCSSPVPHSRSKFEAPHFKTHRLKLTARDRRGAMCTLESAAASHAVGLESAARRKPRRAVLRQLRGTSAAALFCRGKPSPVIARRAPLEFAAPTSHPQNRTQSLVKVHLSALHTPKHHLAQWPFPSSSCQRVSRRSPGRLRTKKCILARAPVQINDAPFHA